MAKSDKVKKIQINRMHQLLGTVPHKVDREFYEEILKTPYGDSVFYNGKKIPVNMTLKAAAETMIKIIEAK